jgi:hypothetical protein
MSASSLDPFDLLDISRREDSYSSVLCWLLRHSSGLLHHVLERAFPGTAPRLINPVVEFRKALPDGAGVPDLLVTGHDKQGRTWQLFIENKIDARESPEQTWAYFKSCHKRFGARAAGIFLTVSGNPPSCSQVVPLGHCELGRWVESSTRELSDPLLRMVAAAYVRRACAPPAQAAPDQIVRRLLERPTGLRPLTDGADALGRAVVETIASGWSHTAFWNQGRGHGNLGLQFDREGWRGTAMSGSRFKRQNHNIHAELDLNGQGAWRLVLHFETEPYKPQRELKKIHGVAKFEVMREKFRKAMHEMIDVSSGWRKSNYPLQICVFKTDITAASRVSEVVEMLAKGLTSVGPAADAALRSVQGNSAV